ncbi:MAG: helix-turn-helix domain-containing protein [Candidatus Diapherotrites archaeon]
MIELLDQIKKLGLNEYEAKAYLTLSRLGVAEISAISGMAGIPRARVYDVLLSLEKKGFVLKKAVKPIQYEVLPIGEVAAGLERKMKKELEFELSELGKLRGLLEKRMAFKEMKGSEGEAVWLVQGRGNIYAKIAREMENCRESVLIYSSKEGIRRKNDAFMAKLAELKGKGLEVKMEENDNNQRFVVFDNNSIMLFLHPESVGDDEEKAVLINSPYLTRHFRSMGK